MTGNGTRTRTGSLTWETGSTGILGSSIVGSCVFVSGSVAGDDLLTRGVTVQGDVACGTLLSLTGVAGAGVTTHLPEVDPQDPSLVTEGL